MSLVETAYFVLSFASLTPLKKVVKGPQLVVVSVAVAAVAVAVVVVAVVVVVVIIIITTTTLF